MSTGMILDGPISVLSHDSSGEVLDLAGLDITELEEHNGTVNYEHQSAKKNGTNGEETVGVITYARKIMSAKDCEDDRQKTWWNRVQLPFLYCRMRLFDGAGHAGAKALAAAIRDQVANNEKILLRWSVEGSTLKKVGNVLKRCVARAVALTWRPCNKACDNGLLEDPNAPEGFSKKPGHKDKDILDSITEKTETIVNPMFMPLGKGSEYEYDSSDLEKAFSAGMPTTAPGNLLGGAALQANKPKIKQKAMIHQAVAAMTKFGKPKNFNKLAFKSFVKANVQDVSDAFLDHFADMVEDLYVRPSLLRVKKSEDSLVKLESLSVSLNKAMSDIKSSGLVGEAGMPQVFSVSVSLDDKDIKAGRFMIFNGQITHLEDYHGLLDTLVPQGPLDLHAIERIHAFKSSSDVKITQSVPGQDPPSAPSNQEIPTIPSTPIQRLKPSVWEYHRAGMERGHTLEINNGTYLLDGNRLSSPEVSTILSNLRNGSARLRYIEGTAVKPGSISSEGSNGLMGTVIKMETAISELLAKADSAMDPDTALQHIRAAVKAGHVHPDVERAMTQHIFEDKMTPGIGNKYAATQFLNKQKPGVYLSLDGNSFKHINDVFGHEAGDQAIGSFGRAAREAMDEAVGRGAGGGKLFRNPDQQDLYRNGGDEFVAHVPSHEHAAKFARALSQKLDALPPVGGTHKLSMSFGLGLDSHTADKALYEAKKQKLHPVTGAKMYEPGAEPNMIHSLVPGHEGAIPIHSPTTAALHAVAEPKTEKPPALAAAE